MYLFWNFIVVIIIIDLFNGPIFTTSNTIIADLAPGADEVEWVKPSVRYFPFSFSRSTLKLLHFNFRTLSP